MNKNLLVLIGIVVIGLGLLAYGLNANNFVPQDSNLNGDLPQPLQGTITQVEQGKDGVQVEMKTDIGTYNVTISVVQTEIVGSIDQIKVGTEVEVSGQGFVGMEPPLIVAEHITVLGVSSDLADEMWTLTTYNDQEPIAGHHPTLKFGAGQVSGTTGCNHYGGSYQVNGESIQFDGLYSTEMACLEPEGLMNQERIYLELLMAADQYELSDGMLIIFAASNLILIFEIQPDEPVLTEPTSIPSNSVSVDVIPTSTTLSVFVPPEGFTPYQDQVTGISVYIPESWIVTGIIEGQYAILQSYPEDKYIGGEGREEGDTKCDLNIQPSGTQVADLVNQWKSDGITTILSEDEFEFSDGVMGKRFEINSMGRSITFVAEINSRVILLTCFGDFSMVEEIAATLRISH